MNFLDDACMAKLKTRMSNLMTWSGKDAQKLNMLGEIHLNLGSLMLLLTLILVQLLQLMCIRSVVLRLENTPEKVVNWGTRGDYILLKVRKKRSQSWGESSSEVKESQKMTKKQQEEGESYGSGKFWLSSMALNFNFHFLRTAISPGFWFCGKHSSCHCRDISATFLAYICYTIYYAINL